MIILLICSSLKVKEKSWLKVQAEVGSLDSVSYIYFKDCEGLFANECSLMVSISGTLLIPKFCDISSHFMFLKLVRQRVVHPLYHVPHMLR